MHQHNEDKNALKTQMGRYVRFVVIGMLPSGDVDVRSTGSEKDTDRLLSVALRAGESSEGTGKPKKGKSKK